MNVFSNDINKNRIKPAAAIMQFTTMKMILPPKKKKNYEHVFFLLPSLVM